MQHKTCLITSFNKFGGGKNRKMKISKFKIE